MTFHTIKWLSPHLAQMREWQEICEAYDYLLSKAFDELDEIYMNQFLDSLTEMGCLIWENLLGITVTQGETTEERRQAIKSYFVGDLPYTENKLRETLEGLAGKDAVKLTVTQSEYELKIDLTVSTPVIVSNVQDIVYRMRPCNMTVRICINYRCDNAVFIGHAVKQTKILTPMSPKGENPIADVSWIVDGDDALLTDSDGSTLIL